MRPEMRNHWLEAVVVAGSGGTRGGFTGYNDREHGWIYQLLSLNAAWQFRRLKPG
jgi:hypothetical protein